MAKEAKKKSFKKNAIKASDTSHNIMAALVKGNPKPKEKERTRKK